MRSHRKVLLKNAAASLNPTKVALSVFSDNPLFPLSVLFSTEQFLPLPVNTYEMLWDRSSLRSLFSEKRKCAPCLQYSNARFKRSIDIHNRTSKRFIGKLPAVVEGKSASTISEIPADEGIRSYSSDGRVVWSVCLLNCRLGFDSESGQTNDFKIGIHSFPA